MQLLQNTFQHNVVHVLDLQFMPKHFPLHNNKGKLKKNLSGVHMLFLKVRLPMLSKNGGSETQRGFFGMWKHLEGRRKNVFFLLSQLAWTWRCLHLLHSSGSVVIGILWPGHRE